MRADLRRTAGELFYSPSFLFALFVLFFTLGRPCARGRIINETITANLSVRATYSTRRLLCVIICTYAGTNFAGLSDGPCKNKRLLLDGMSSNLYTYHVNKRLHSNDVAKTVSLREYESMIDRNSVANDNSCYYRHQRRASRPIFLTRVKMLPIQINNSFYRVPRKRLKHPFIENRKPLRFV